MTVITSGSMTVITSGAPSWFTPIRLWRMFFTQRLHSSFGAKGAAVKRAVLAPKRMSRISCGDHSSEAASFIGSAEACMEMAFQRVS